MHTVVPQGNVEMTGETRLSQLQPASNLLQTTEQGKAEGRTGWGSLGIGRGVSGLGDLIRRRLGDVWCWGFRLHPFRLFIG